MALEEPMYLAGDDRGAVQMTLSGWRRMEDRIRYLERALGNISKHAYEWPSEDIESVADAALEGK